MAGPDFRGSLNVKERLTCLVQIIKKRDNILCKYINHLAQLSIYHQVSSLKSVIKVILASLAKLGTWLLIDGLASVNSKLLCIEQHLNNIHLSDRSGRQLYKSCCGLQY
jgi:hypothetical protein